MTSIYVITVKKVFSFDVEVMAENEEEAIQIAEDNTVYNFKDIDWSGITSESAYSEIHKTHDEVEQADNLCYICKGEGEFEVIASDPDESWEETGANFQYDMEICWQCHGKGYLTEDF